MQMTVRETASLTAFAPKRVLARLGVLLGLVFLAGCASDPEPPAPTEIVAKISAVDSLNPDPQGRASPLVLRLYELSAAAPYDTADFFDLFDKDQATLGETLVARDEIRVLPSETKTVRRSLDPRTSHIGILAAFRDVQLSTWRGLVEVPPNTTTTYDLTLDSLSVGISPVSE